MNATNRGFVQRIKDSCKESGLEPIHFSFFLEFQKINSTVLKMDARAQFLWELAENDYQQPWCT